MRRMKVQLCDFKRGLQKIWSWAKTKQKEMKNETPIIVSPVMIPFSSIPLVRTFNRDSVVKTVKEMCNNLDFREPILLTTLPNAGDYIGAFDEAVSIYYCVDDFIRWPGVYETVVREQEARLLNEIDLLVCSSEELAKIKPANAEVKILHHGVDYRHFSSLPSDIPENFPIKGIKRPIVGYFGLFGEWIDLGLLEKTVKHYSDISFVIIGNVAINADRLYGCRNVHFVGPVPYMDLPAYISFMDVLILPYRVEDRGQTITPLKLREYLATGKPVVTTSIPECRLFERYLYLAESHDDFIGQLVFALNSSKTSPEDQKNAVSNEDWQFKAEAFSTMIGEILAQK
jgi:glycosyltransferase involved in cell wall biosynthesis